MQDLVKTADMRQLPFPEDYFDAIVSNWTVHNKAVSFGSFAPSAVSARKAA
jgi:hypothetical protein